MPFFVKVSWDVCDIFLECFWLTPYSLKYFFCEHFAGLVSQMCCIYVHTCVRANYACAHTRAYIHNTYTHTYRHTHVHIYIHTHNFYYISRVIQMHAYGNFANFFSWKWTRWILFLTLQVAMSLRLAVGRIVWYLGNALPVPYIFILMHCDRDARTNWLCSWEIYWLPCNQVLLVS